MFNQERGAAEGKAAETCPNLHASSKRLPGRVKWLLWLPGSVWIRGSLKWKDGGSSQPGTQLSALAFGFVKCLRFACHALTQKKRERREEANTKGQRWQGSPAQAPGSAGQQPCSHGTAALPCKGCFWHLSSSSTGLRNIKLAWWPSAL